jgi:hypothetical protein
MFTALLRCCLVGLVERYKFSLQQIEVAAHHGWYDYAQVSCDLRAFRPLPGLRT